MSERCLKICTYNIDNGFKREALLSTINELKNKNVSIFCFQEIREGYHDSFIGKHIKEILGSSWEATYFLSENNPLNDLGLAFFFNTTEVSLNSVEKVHLPKLARFSLLEKRQLNSAIIPQRGATIATFRGKGSLFRVVNTHFDWQGGRKHRLEQLKYILTHLSNNDLPTAICGDFNTTELLLSNKLKHKRLHRHFGNTYIEAFPKQKYTWDLANTSLNPNYGLQQLQNLALKVGLHWKMRLDYIWISGCSLLEAEMPELVGSDHYPLVVEVKV